MLVCSCELDRVQEMSRGHAQRKIPVKQKKILHLISNLEMGGAEVMLQRLVERTERDGYVSRVVSMTDVGVIGERIRALGVPVDSLGMRRSAPRRCPPGGQARGSAGHRQQGWPWPGRISRGL